MAVNFQLPTRVQSQPKMGQAQLTNDVGKSDVKNTPPNTQPIKPQSIRALISSFVTNIQNVLPMKTSTSQNVLPMETSTAPNLSQTVVSLDVNQTPPGKKDSENKDLGDVMDVLNSAIEENTKRAKEALGVGAVHTSNFDDTELIQLRQISRSLEDFPNARIQAHDGAPPANSNAWLAITALNLGLPGVDSASRIEKTDFSMSQKKNIGSSQCAFNQCLSPIQEEETFIGVSIKKIFKTIQFPFRLTAMIAFGAADLASGSVLGLVQLIKKRNVGSDLSKWDRFSQGGQTRKAFYEKKIRPGYRAIAVTLSQSTGFETLMRKHKSLEHKTIGKLNNKIELITLRPEGERKPIIEAAKKDVNTLLKENTAHKAEIIQKEEEYLKRFDKQPPKTTQELQKEIIKINKEIEDLKDEDSQAAGVKASERKPYSASVDSYVKPLSDAYKTGKAQILPVVNFFSRITNHKGVDHTKIMNLRMRKNDLQELIDQKNKVFSMDKRLCDISIGLDMVENNLSGSFDLKEKELHKLFDDHNIQDSDRPLIKEEILAEQKTKQEALSFATEFNKSIDYFYKDGQTLELPFDLTKIEKENLERLLTDIHQNPDNFAADSISEKRLKSLESLVKNSKGEGFKNALMTIIKFVKKNSFLGTLRSKDLAVINHFSTIATAEYAVAIGMGGGGGLADKGATAVTKGLQFGNKMAIAIGASIVKFISYQVSSGVGTIKSNLTKSSVQNKIDQAADSTATFVQDCLVSRLMKRLDPNDEVQTKHPSTTVKTMTVGRFFKKGASALGRKVGIQTKAHIKKTEAKGKGIKTAHNNKTEASPDVDDPVITQKRTQLYNFLEKKASFDKLVVGAAKKEETGDKDDDLFENNRIKLIEMEKDGFSNELDAISSDRTMMSILRSELLAAKQDFDIDDPNQTKSTFFDTFDSTLKTSCPTGGGIAELLLIPQHKQSFFLKKAGASTQSS